MSADVEQPATLAVPIRDNDGYYHMPDGRKLISVTTIIEHGIPRPNLLRWTSWEVAKCAMDSLIKLVRAHGDDDRKDAQTWLQGAADRVRDEAADRGSAIHDIIEARILGAPHPEPTLDQLPYVAAFERFQLRWQPRWEATEMVLANYTDGWAGRGDVLVWLTLPDVGPVPVITAGDWKTGRNVHPEVALQLSAYVRAEVGFLRDGTQIVPPKVEHAVVLHLRPDKYAGGYAVKRVDISDDTYAAFLNAQRTAEGWVRGHSKTVLQRAYREPPIPASAREVA